MAVTHGGAQSPQDELSTHWPAHIGSPVHRQHVVHAPAQLVPAPRNTRPWSAVQFVARANSHPRLAPSGEQHAPQVAPLQLTPGWKTPPCCSHPPIDASTQEKSDRQQPPLISPADAGPAAMAISANADTTSCIGPTMRGITPPRPLYERGGLASI